MTLEGGGGGGGGVFSSVTNAISDVLGTSGGGGGVLGALADFDKGVSNVIPGGWGTIGTAVATYFGGPLGAAAAQGVEGAVKGEDWDKTLKDMAIATAAAYASQGIAEGLSSGTQAAPITDYSTLSDAAVQESLEQAIKLPTEVPYVDMADGANLLTPNSAYPSVPSPNYVPDEASGPYMDGTPPTTSGTPSPNVIPPDMNLDLPYQDLPDGATQLSYDQLVQQTATTPPVSLEEEKLKEKFFNDLINSSQNNNVPIFDYSTPADAATQKMAETGYLERLSQLPGATYDMAKSYVKEYPMTSIGLGLGALSMMNAQQPQPQPQEQYIQGDSRYRGGYGSSGGVASPYLLKNRINASNIYDYENPIDERYAKGGEVKHFSLGGISNALTRTFQPFEKAILQPIGQAVPFAKELAPYAGIMAAPFIGSPIAAAGIGGLTSGFGRPGTGFNMKRALMGGIAAYGASTLGAGIEAAGTEPTKPLVDTLAESYAVPGTEIPASTVTPKGFFRDTDAMQRGVGNLLSPSTYDKAAANFGTQAGIYKTGVPIIMGTSGMMAIDEAQKMQEDADRAAAASKGESNEMLARIAKGKKRAEQAVRENPYMYAMGGQVDDELGGDYSAMGMDQGNMQKGLFGMGYAAGGMPRFLSGGGDGMSDSIKANIEGTQEARLADGEFVIPADVVSHLGNGSSKAGAKQLYSMMDRVRKARTGNEKQGRQIKPNKLMPA